MIIDYLITLGLFIGFDLIWLKFLAKGLYKGNIGHLLTNNPNRVAALLFYLLFATGLLVFVVYPSTSVQITAMLGAFFGLITYSTYDLTNQATLKKWPVKITVIDMIWGSFIGSVVSTISYLLINNIY
jgi:uncharacterized membrane protein